MTTNVLWDAPYLMVGVFLFVISMAFGRMFASAPEGDNKIGAFGAFLILSTVSIILGTVALTNIVVHVLRQNGVL